MSDTLPDRLSVNPKSPYYDADLLQQGIGILFTSHRPLLLAAADRVLLLRGGQLVAAPGTPALPAPQPGGPRATRAEEAA